MALWSWRTWPDPLIDFGQQLYVSWRLAEGDVLYRDVAYLYGPLSPYLNALCFRLFGCGLTTLVACNLAILAGVFVLLYRIVSAISSRASATIAGMTFATVFAIAPSYHDPDVIWAGSDDGYVHVTRDGGGNWENVTPPDAPDFVRINTILSAKQLPQPLAALGLLPPFEELTQTFACHRQHTQVQKA